MEEEKNLIECPICGELKSDVDTRPNHYAQYVYDEVDETMVCCEECEEQNILDI